MIIPAVGSGLAPAKAEPNAGLNAIGGLMPRTLICLLLFVAPCLPVFAGKDIKKAIKHYGSAGQDLKSNDIDGAVAEYRKALKEDPDERYWHLALAMALNGKGDRQGILDDYEVARKLAPDDEASVRVVKPLGLGLDENAVKVIRTWKFHPAIREGAPVAVRLLVKTSFRLF